MSNECKMYEINEIDVPNEKITIQLMLLQNKSIGIIASKSMPCISYSRLLYNHSAVSLSTVVKWAYNLKTWYYMV